MHGGISNRDTLHIDALKIGGPGAVILTGPSSCGKGEVARALCSYLSIPPERAISMGEMLRNCFGRVDSDPGFARLLERKYDISASVPVLESSDSTPELEDKVRRHAEPLKTMLSAKRKPQTGEVDIHQTTQLEWLEYCTTNGLLVPDRWTQNLISAHIESTPPLKTQPFILDGYPRTIEAASHLLDTLDAEGIPVAKVLHLSISKQEMLHRAGIRKRSDDTLAALTKRYEFYVDHVQPSVDYIKERLGSRTVALIDAHQPEYDGSGATRRLNVERSIQNVVNSSLAALGLPASIPAPANDRLGLGFGPARTDQKISLG